MHIEVGLDGALSLSILHSCFFVCLFSSLVLMNEAKTDKAPKVFTMYGNLLEVKCCAVFRTNKITVFVFSLVLLVGFHLAAIHAPKFH